MPTIARSGPMADWNGDLERWLAPFLARLGHKARRRMCPLYVAGLIGPGDRKSVEPMAARLAPNRCQAKSPWHRYQRKLFKLLAGAGGFEPPYGGIKILQPVSPSQERYVGTRIEDFACISPATIRHTPPSLRYLVPTWCRHEGKGGRMRAKITKRIIDAAETRSPSSLSDLAH